MKYKVKKGIKKKDNINYLNKWIAKLFLKYTSEYYRTDTYTISAYQYGYEKVSEYVKILRKKA